MIYGMDFFLMAGIYSTDFITLARKSLASRCARLRRPATLLDQASAKQIFVRDCLPRPPH